MLHTNFGYPWLEPGAVTLHPGGQAHPSASDAGGK